MRIFIYSGILAGNKDRERDRLGAGGGGGRIAFRVVGEGDGAEKLKHKMR